MEPIPGLLMMHSHFWKPSEDLGTVWAPRVTPCASDLIFTIIRLCPSMTVPHAHLMKTREADLPLKCLENSPHQQHEIEVRVFLWRDSKQH